jgi:hypothetical protein
MSLGNRYCKQRALANPNKKILKWELRTTRGIKLLHLPEKRIE